MTFKVVTTITFLCDSVMEGEEIRAELATAAHAIADRGHAGFIRSQLTERIDAAAPKPAVPSRDLN